LNKIILSHAGKQHSYYVARTLLESGFLETFITSSYVRPKWLQDLVLKKDYNFWTKRFLTGMDGNYVCSNWRFEIPELISSRIFGKGRITQSLVFRRDTLFDQYVSRQLKKIDSNIFWGFQGSCHQSLLSAKESGKITIVELSNAHISSAKKILNEERLLHPEWADSFDNLDFPDYYEKRLIEEPFRADWVLAASRFTLKTLLTAGVNENKILYLPLGADISKIAYNEKKDFSNRPLKLLYVGRITQRKGIKYLLESMKVFKKDKVELTIIGFIHGSGKALDKYKNLFNLLPAVSQNVLFRIYQEYDVLVLPSVFEGFGLVIAEAMAAGLMVITTENSIGPDIIIEDENGYIVPIRNSQAICNSISKLLNKKPEALRNMSHAARNAALNYSWENYKTRLNSILSEKIFGATVNH
jgi:starch synthase